MLVSDHARMLAVAPGGWDRCICRHCRLPESKIHHRQSARRIERRLLADEIAEAMDEAVEVAEVSPLAYESVVAQDVAAYWAEREAEDMDEILFTGLPTCYCRRCFLHNDPGGCLNVGDWA